MQAVMKWVRHNQGVTVSIAICLVLLIWSFGCESKVESLVKPGVKVNRAEFALEVQELSRDPETDPDWLWGRAQLGFESLDRDDAVRQKLFEFAALSASTGGVSTAGVITLIGSILGIGAIADNRIKDKVIKNRPLQAKVITGNIKTGEAVSQRLKDNEES